MSPFGREREGERRIVFRFNKIFSEHGRNLRAEVGKIVADHAAKGLLKSGATVKRLHEALGMQLKAAIEDALSLVSNKTDHAGPYRSRLLDQLRDQVRHHSNGYKNIIQPKVDMATSGTGEAANAADRIFQESMTYALDLIDKYDDGLTAPKDVKWHLRHPLLAGAIGIVATAIVSAFVAQLFGWIDLPGTARSSAATSVSARTAVH